MKLSEKIKNVLVILSVIIVGAIAIILVLHFFPINKQTVEKNVSQVSVSESDTIKSGVDKVYNSVVVVETYKGTQLSSTGTGFVYKKDDKKGYIITNHHVIGSNGKIKVVNMNGDSVDATVLGTDEYEDIAVLSVDANSVLGVAETGNTQNINIGDTLFTVGTPVGANYMGTVTKGILSGKDRTVTVNLDNGGSYVMEVLQTDAAINPGNSGGPLCNINGQVIGVNSLKLVQDTIEGMGFAIPIDLVMSTVDKLEKGEKIVRPVLGVETLDVDNTYALYKNNVVLGDGVSEGVVVINVVDNTPAKVAQFKKGDVILEIDGNKVSDSAHLKYLLYKYSIGDTIKIKYYRDNKISDVSIKLTKALGE